MQNIFFVQNISPISMEAVFPTVLVWAGQAHPSTHDITAPLVHPWSPVMVTVVSLRSAGVGSQGIMCSLVTMMTLYDTIAACVTQEGGWQDTMAVGHPPAPHPLCSSRHSTMWCPRPPASPTPARPSGRWPGILPILHSRHRIRIASYRVSKQTIHNTLNVRWCLDVNCVKLCLW